jgi:glycosyltransferase involved in cell wall biosynthesis
VSGAPAASIVVPTRSRPGYLEVTLSSVAGQARDAGCEVIVVNDGADPATETLAERYGVRLASVAPPKGLNAARNLGVKLSRSDLVIFIDDDVEAPPGWLQALLEGAGSAPDREVFGGPIRARLEGAGLRPCGREAAPISTLDGGPVDRDIPLVWGANMAIRRRAFDDLGGFDEQLAGRGDEEEWELRYAAAGGRIRYLARAGLDHRRTAADSRLGRLVRDAYGHGRAARRNDVRKRAVPPLRRELRTLLGCVWHTARRRCGNGVVMAAHSAGRIREALSEGRR